ncbi:MAG: hypothetical protein LKG19_12045 [Saprospiraceae bacterium]|nr:hypothetical protein [Saprospiraceae bacterium]
MKDFVNLLSGGDLRSIGKSNSVVSLIVNQQDFDELFKLIFLDDQLLVMRAIDAIEKITLKLPNYLIKHKNEILNLSTVAHDKELKWHLAQIIPRLSLTPHELTKAWKLLTNWALDKNNSRIVRVNSIQGLFEMLKENNELTQDFALTLTELEKEDIPSINVRIRSIKNKI